MSAAGWHLAAALGCGLYGVLAGLLVPALIAAVPEPRAEHERPAEEGAAGPRDVAGAQPATPARPEEPPEEPPDEPPKERYVDIAARPGLRWRAALATGGVAALVGARLGWAPELAFLLYLAPVGVALAVIDWRTRLLPTRIIAPSYLVVGVLAVAAAATGGHWHRLETAGWGWLVSGGTFFLLWLIYPRGMGYGDVRLSGLLGIALGYLGWGALLSGVYAGFLLGGVGGLLLSALRLVDRKAYPFGPFMLLGALAGVLVGPWFAAWYA